MDQLSSLPGCCISSSFFHRWFLPVSPCHLLDAFFRHQEFGTKPWGYRGMEDEEICIYSVQTGKVIVRLLGASFYFFYLAKCFKLKTLVLSQGLFDTASKVFCLGALYSLLTCGRFQQSDLLRRPTTLQSSCCWFSVEEWSIWRARSG